MDIIQAIIIGLVQGLTEFLPVSSSAHLIFAQQALGVADVGLAFDVLLHVGTLVAVIVYFFNDIVNMIKGFLLSLVDLKDGNFMGELKKDPYKKLAWLTILATIPIGIVGVLFNDIVESMFQGLTVPAFLLLITGMSCSGTCWLLGDASFQCEVWRLLDALLSINVPWSQEFSGVLRFWT